MCNELTEPIATTSALGTLLQNCIGGKSTVACVNLTDSGINSIYGIVVLFAK